MEEEHSQADNREESWGLHHLDPSPVEEDDPLLSPDTLGSTSTSISAASDQKRPLTRSSTLGLSSHTAVYYRTFSYSVSLPSLSFLFFVLSLAINTG